MPPFEARFPEQSNTRAIEAPPEPQGCLQLQVLIVVKVLATAENAETILPAESQRCVC